MIKIDKLPFWMATGAFTLGSIIITGIMRLIEKNINSSDYALLKNYFSTTQSQYYPVIYLIMSFLAAVAVVYVYQLLRPNLPSTVIRSGLLIGGFLFLVGALPNAIYTGFNTVVTSAIGWGNFWAALFGSLINGCILTYTYYRFSPEWKEKHDK